MREANFELNIRPVPTELFFDVGLDADDIAAVRRLAKAYVDLADDDARTALGAALRHAVPRWSRCVSRILDCLARPPYFCVLRRSAWVDLPVEDLHKTVTALASPLGCMSDDNAYRTRSGIFADDVRPLDPTSLDVTYSFDCEVHSDESSKPTPEDVVTLWCVRAGLDGGGSLVWSGDEIIATLRASPDGEKQERFLRRHRFPFGGKLRQPPRVLLAPILFGASGIRFGSARCRTASTCLAVNLTRMSAAPSTASSPQYG
jgi:hypothetical protein